jgi:hypothetical protein
MNVYLPSKSVCTNSIVMVKGYKILLVPLQYHSYKICNRSYLTPFGGKYLLIMENCLLNTNDEVRSVS